MLKIIKNSQHVSVQEKNIEQLKNINFQKQMFLTFASQFLLFLPSFILVSVELSNFGQKYFSQLLSDAKRIAEKVPPSLHHS